MKVAVTGGAGFIGSTLVRRLMAAGHSVVVLDNLSNGRKDFLEPFLKLKPSKFRFHKVDIRDTTKLKRVLTSDIEMIYHLAANADIARGIEEPSLDFEHSIVATFSLLRAMRDRGIKKIFYTSGSGVYGDRGLNFSAESFGPLTPNSMYGAGKLSAESLISAFAQLYEMRAWIVRPANIVGPRATHGVIFDFIKRLKKDPNYLRILGNGHQTKSYLHVDDVIDAFFLIQKKAKDQIAVYNLSSATFIKVNEIAEIVIEEMDLRSVEIERGKATVGWKGDVAIVYLKCEPLKKLGWAPKMNSAQAVRATARSLLADPRFQS